MSNPQEATIITLPMLPMREDIIYPGMTIPFFIGRKQSMEAVERALEEDKRIFVATQKNTSVENPKEADLFGVGTIGNILQIMRLPNGTLKALYEAKSRARLVCAKMDQDYYGAEVTPIAVVQNEGPEILALAQKVGAGLKMYLAETKKSPGEIDATNILQSPPYELADRIAPLLVANRELKQQILETEDPRVRLEQVYSQMIDESEVRRMERRLKDEAQKNVGTTHRDSYLNSQLRQIQKELGQTDDTRDEFDELEAKINASGMPEPAEEVAHKELRKLKLMSPMSAEANVGRNYLDWLVSLPWNLRTEGNFDLEFARQVLDEDHYGLAKVKERIIEYLAVCSLKGEIKGPIMCLVGPPGVGKTSLARSIARATGRNFARMSLGGLRDEAEIRGHRRTYIGAMPGKIMQAVRKSKSRNPVILMDEVDKLYSSIMGDPSAALLEVLDPEQNNTFMDHYVEVEYDLSEVMFITTANSTEPIAAPLLDRMETLSIPGYTELEKIKIAETHLVPKQRKEHGLEDKNIRVRNDALRSIVEGYTREAGVRNLEREIGKVFRKVVTQLVKTNKMSRMTVTEKSLSKYLGVPRFQHTEPQEQGEIGITNGLGVTSSGGELLITEVETMQGTGKLAVTGQLGNVMKESTQIAHSYLRTKAHSLGIFSSELKKLDLHIHLPEGATPKDGPSAGVTLVTSLVSAITRIPVRNDIAMTGEITLRGVVLQIGGLKEKLLAARRGRIKEVIIPKENEKDLAEVSDEILRDLKISPVSMLNEVLKIALNSEPRPLTEEQVREDERSFEKQSAASTPEGQWPRDGDHNRLTLVDPDLDC